MQCSEVQYVRLYVAYKLQTHVYTHSKSGKSMFDCLSVLLGKITMQNNNKTKTSNLLVHQGIDTSKTGLLAFLP